jgi:hypothetical protein
MISRGEAAAAEAYRFSEQRWERIQRALKDANPEALEVNDDGVPFRVVLEWCVNGFLIARKEERNFDRQRARAAMKRIEIKARRLREELEKLGNVAWHGPAVIGGLDDPRRDYTNWEDLIEKLRATEEAADWQYRTLKKFKRPADLPLEFFLTQVAQIYEQATWRRASPSTSAPGKKHKGGEVTGPFLRYVQAVTSKLPGEKRDLTPHQIRHFARHFNEMIRFY